MSTFFRDNLLTYLPSEFARTDLELDDLKNYLQVVAISMDELNDAIEEFPNIIDVDGCEAKYLPYIAKLLNYPLSPRDDEASQRVQLKNAIKWYKRKGLHESFRILFYSLGYVANVVELWTRDYLTFYRYPGTWRPPVFVAKAQGISGSTVDITYATRALAIMIDGSDPITVLLTVGEDRLITDVAAEIDAALDVVNGDCVVSSGVLTIKSRRAGADASVKFVTIENSAYGILGFSEKTYHGIDYKVPDDWPELMENGGKWYKSPHFGVEIYSIKNFTFDPEEALYLRERLELVRPIHTVLDFLDYIKAIGDAFDVEEGDIVGEIVPELVEVWPFSVCIDRGKNSEFEYIRDGLVPDRSEVVRVAYKHIRNAANNVHYRGEFVYEYENLFRNSVSGPVQMPKRDTLRYFRGGYPVGEPTRSSCAHDSETVVIDFGFEEQQTWCMEFLRDGGTKFRNQPDTYYRDGSFTLITSRNPHWFNRDGSDETLDRSGCNLTTDTDDGLLFERADLPGVFFRSLWAMSDPYTLGLADLPLPQPGETGPSL